MTEHNPIDLTVSPRRSQRARQDIWQSDRFAEFTEGQVKRPRRQEPVAVKDEDVTPSPEGAALGAVVEDDWDKTLTADEGGSADIEPQKRKFVFRPTQSQLAMTDDASEHSSHDEGESAVDEPKRKFVFRPTQSQRAMTEGTSQQTPRDAAMYALYHPPAAQVAPARTSGSQRKFHCSIE